MILNKVLKEDTMSIFDQFSKVTKDFGNKAQEMTERYQGQARRAAGHFSFECSDK